MLYNFCDISGRQVVEEKTHFEMINDEDDRRALKELESCGGHRGLLDPGIDYPELTVCSSEKH